MGVCFVPRATNARREANVKRNKTRNFLTTEEFNPKGL
jgi:hypothetical protein